MVGTLNHCAGAMVGTSVQELFGDGGDSARERTAGTASRICGVSQIRRSKPVVAKVVKACASKKDTPRSDQRGRKRKMRSVDGCSTARHSAWPVGHEQFNPLGAQCQFTRMAPHWLLFFGSHTHNVNRAVMQITWLRERPSHLLGAWAIGCSLCSSLVSRLQNINHPRRRQRTWCTKWARFEVRHINCVQSSAMRLHASTNLHKLAVKAWLCPAEPLLQWLQSDPEDDELLRGSAPQLEQWLRAWRYAKTQLRCALPSAFKEQRPSWRAAGRLTR